MTSRKIVLQVEIADAIFRMARSDDRKWVCCSQATLARTLARILFVPVLRPPRIPESVANLKKAICVARSDSIIGVTRFVIVRV